MLKTKKHNADGDRTCTRCGWAMKAFIPHECDPSICWQCDGRATVYMGRDKETGEWIGYTECAACEGTGETIWKK